MSDGSEPGSDERRPSVVVTATRYPHGYASVRSLGKRGIRTIAAVERADLPVTASRYCDEAVEVPPASDLPAYREALLDLARREDVETIVPHRLRDTFVLSRHRDEFDRYVDVVVPRFDVLGDVLDRMRLVATADRAGVAVPGTSLLGDVDGWGDRRIVRARYPLLTDEFVDDLDPGESDLVTAVEHVPPGTTPDVGVLCERMGHEPIVQEYGPAADAYAFGALYHRGTALATYQQRQIRTDAYGGAGVYRETVADPDLEAAGRAVLDELEWHGLACVEFVESAETGEYELVDVDPRMWASLPVAVRSGADFAHWYLLQTRGAVEDILPEYEVGVESHYLSGEIEHLRSVLTNGSEHADRASFPVAAWSVLASCARSRNFDYVHRDDPSPAIRQLRNGVSRAVGRRL